MSTTTKSNASPSNRPITTKEMVIAGMSASVLAVFSQISLPMPTGVPITIQVFAIALTGVILGWRLGLLSVTAYILLGAVGLPVFANFKGGLAALTSFTGGYIWTWPLMVVFCGIRPKTSCQPLNNALILLFSLAGLAVNEIGGGLQWAALSGDMSAKGVFLYSLAAFIPKDLILTILAVFLGLPLRKLVFRAISIS